MKGFLSKFLRTSKGDQKPYAQSRQEPKLTARPRDELHEITEDLHPDETFIDYDVSNDVGQLSEPSRNSEQTSYAPAELYSNMVPSGQDHFDEVLQDNVEQDSYQAQSDNEYDPFEPPQGFNPGWVTSVQENKIVKSLSIKTTLDGNGSGFIHYAAAFGKSHLLKQLIEDGWPLEKQNYHGKTPYDFAVHYKNSINTYFIENVLKALRKNSHGEEEDLSNAEDDSEHGEAIVENATPASIDSLPNKTWVTLAETSKCPKEFWGHRYDTSATDEHGNTLLHYAAKIGNKPYTLHLLGLGWGILDKNYDSLTPLNVAEIDEHIDLVDTLKRLYSSFLAEHADNAVNVETSLTEVELLAPQYADAHDTISNRAIQSEESPSFEPPEVFNEIPEIEKIVQTTEFLQKNIRDEETPATPACVKCGTSFADFNPAIKLWFCPFCSAAQPNDEVSKAGTDSQSGYSVEDKVFSENTDDDYQAESLEDRFVEEDTHSSTTTSQGKSQRPEESKETHQPEAIPNSPSEEAFGSVDEGFDDNFLDLDLENYQPVSRGRNSSDEWHATKNNLDRFSTDSEQIEDWEIFLDEDLEEQAHPSDQYFEDEDPLEQGKIVEYASRLASRIAYYQSKDRRKIYAFFINILGDFPFYQSYAAIERLISKGSQIEDIRDAYSVKLLWMTNPNIWSSRRYNRLENNWSVSRNLKLRNSMSWQLASDIVQLYTANELENLILNDWYAEWLNLPLQGGDTASGIDPSYSLYSTYLYEKRSLMTSNVDNR
jgi:ankyrin repeat protein